MFKKIIENIYDKNHDKICPLSESTALTAPTALRAACSLSVVAVCAA